MASLSDLLSWMDNKRRVAGRNVADLAQNPSDYLSMTAANIPQTVREYGEDPMNFVGGGSLKLVKGGKVRPQTPMEDFGLLNYEPPMQGAMRVPTVQESGVGSAMKKLSAPKGVDFSTIPDERGLYPVTVDGVAVFFEPTLLEARNAAKSVAMDGGEFWRGEMQNFTPAQLRPFEPRRPLNDLMNVRTD